MKFVIFACVFLTFTLGELEYLYDCNLNYNFETECYHYNFNEINCFPWNTSSCLIINVEENVMCYSYTCLVRFTIFLSAIGVNECHCSIKFVKKILSFVISV